MQDYANSNRLSLRTFLFFIVLVILAYLPVSSFQFFLKNDAFNGYFPPKFFMSESIHAGYLPLWNPYINYGIPQYADMSSGFWNPITWIIASTTGYNAYSFTLEVLFYLLLSGIGMYRLCSLWVHNKHIILLAAVCYMCSGFHVGHLQHVNWLSGAAFLPFCIYQYIRLLTNYQIRHVVRTAFYIYMLTAAAHPGITISCIYLFVFIALFQFGILIKHVPFREKFKEGIRTHIPLLFFVLLLSAGMIVGYLDILPQFVRTEKVALTESLSNPTTIKSWISFLLPMATVKADTWFQTDISMRNLYVGILFLLFFTVVCFSKKTAWQKFFLAVGLFFLLLATGGFFKQVAWNYLPLIGHIRLNGEFRIFALCSFIPIAAISMESFIHEKKEWNKKVQLIYYIFELVLIGLIIYGFYASFSQKLGIFYSFDSIRTAGSIPLKLKQFIDVLSMGDCLWIQGILQLISLWFIKYGLKKQEPKIWFWTSIVNVVLFCLIQVPFTGVGKAPLHAVQTALNKSPKGIPIPNLKPINLQDSLPPNEKELLGDWSFYNKQPGCMEWAPYPIRLKGMDDYFNRKVETERYTNKPFVFAEPFTNQNSLTIAGYTPTNLKITIHKPFSGALVLQQNSYSHWVYSINNGNEQPVIKYDEVFMSAPVSERTDNVHFSFKPIWIIRLMIFSAICLLVTGSFLLFSYIKSIFPS